MQEIVEGYKNKLKNKMFSLLCEREHDGTWESQLESIIIEIEGIPEEQRTINYLSIYFKLNSLKYLEYKYFRKTVFEIMNLISKGDYYGVL